MSNTIANSLGIQTPAPVEYNTTGMVMALDTDKEADVKYVREQLYNLTMKGAGALGDLVDLAASSQDYHMYDSVAKLIDSLTKSNIQLAKLAFADPDATKTQEEKKLTQVNNNTMNFVGTSSDMIDALMKQIADRNKEYDNDGGNS